jgi:hypothetical protein
MNLFNTINFPISMQPTPSTFNEGFSYYETVSKMIYLVNQMIEQVNQNSNESESLKSDYNDFLVNVKSLQDELDKFKNGNTFPDGSISLSKFAIDTLNQIKDYVKDSMYDMNNFVTFGLEDDRLVAYIPETWKDITFSTNPDGQLVLEF